MVVIELDVFVHECGLSSLAIAAKSFTECHGVIGSSVFRHLFGDVGKNELNGMACAIVHGREPRGFNSIGYIGWYALWRKVLKKLVGFGGVV